MASFDYHLDSAEQTQVESLVPLHQAKIHLAFRANITVDESLHKQGAVAISEHLIVICKKKLLGKGFSNLQIIPIVDILEMATEDDFTFTFVTQNNSIQIKSGAAMRAARTILRNYIISFPMIPPKLRFRFTPHNASHFPPFQPQISPSQAFQFTYYANCSYYDTTYCHQVVQYYHRLMSTSTGIFDINKLPLSSIEYNMGEAVDLRPLFAGLMFSPYIYAICCSDICRPDLISSIALMIGVTTSLRVVSLEKCQCEGGLDELARAIQINPHLEVSYWDLSGNPFKDMYPLMASFMTYPSDVFFLDFSETGMNAQSSEVLFSAIEGNKHFQALEYLHLRSCYISKTAASLFNQHLRRLHELRIMKLKSLDIGDCGKSSAMVLEGLSQYPQPLKSLKFANTSISKQCLKSLLTIIQDSKDLVELDISGTGIGINELSEIISSISNNNNLKAFKLWVGNLGLSGKKFIQFLELLQNSDMKKWTMLSFERNGLSGQDLEKLIEILNRLPNLQILRLGYNFTSKTNNIEALLTRLLDFEQIKGLSLAGDSSKHLGEALIPFLDTMRNNTTLKSIDIRGTRIGDNGVRSLTQMVRKNSVLSELKYDELKPDQFENLLKLFDAICMNDHLVSCKFPSNDSYRLVVKKSRREMNTVLCNKQASIQLKLEANQARAFVHSFLATKNIESLDKLIDDLSVDLLEKLSQVQCNIHSAVASILNLPLPFQNSDESCEKGGDMKKSSLNSSSELYDAAGGDSTIIEKVDQNISSLQTLQYNSLCIRRPGAASIKSVDKIPEMKEKSKSKRKKSKHHSSRDNDSSDDDLRPSVF